ncbi:unnamed protein product [Pleuronectes platessa]|uniref:Uncharacterized protein n=1 Tax=Pleuronectes platessa TaxID=8262 RepID=A0A9N7UKS1_PLEPL|nr:unnamed protein product [Pleuronectes platessa]
MKLIGGSLITAACLLLEELGSFSSDPPRTTSSLTPAFFVPHHRFLLNLSSHIHRKAAVVVVVVLVRSCRLHSGIRCPVEDDPPDIRAPDPGVRHQAPRFPLIAAGNTGSMKDVAAVACGGATSGQREENLQDREKGENQTRSVSASFGSGAGDGRLLRG